MKGGGLSVLWTKKIVKDVVINNKCKFTSVVIHEVRCYKGRDLSFRPVITYIINIMKNMFSKNGEDTRLFQEFS